MDAKRFAPFAELAAQLLPRLDGVGDGAHDLWHVERVWRNARAIQQEEGGDAELLAAAVLLHDAVEVPKNSPLRSQASRLAAERAAQILGELGWPTARIELVSGAILTHSFSAGLTPTSLEGRILQDADRLDAIGFTGVARCFYTAGHMSSSLYHGENPRGEGRELDDNHFALDHFPKKLLTLAQGFQTATGARLAQQRHQNLLHFYEGMLAEVGG